MNTIEITEAEYESLCRDSDVLTALLAAGVENWQGFQDALDILDELVAETDKPKEIK